MNLKTGSCCSSQCGHGGLRALATIYSFPREATLAEFSVSHPTFSMSATNSTLFRGTEDKSGYSSPTSQHHGLPSDPSHPIWDPLFQLLT